MLKCDHIAFLSFPDVLLFLYVQTFTQSPLTLAFLEKNTLQSEIQPRESRFRAHILFIKGCTSSWLNEFLLLHLRVKLYSCSSLTVSQEELIFLQMRWGKMSRSGRMEKAVNAVSDGRVHWQFEKSDGVAAPLYRTRVKAYTALAWEGREKGGWDIRDELMQAMR